jgi:hypothetical protein
MQGLSGAMALNPLVYNGISTLTVAKTASEGSSQTQTGQCV